MANEIYITGIIKSVIKEEDLWSSQRYCTPDDVKWQLNWLAESKAKKATLYMDSCGGDVYAGYRIYTMLKNSGLDITVQVDGICASIATFIAMAGNKIQMAEFARWLVHNPAISPNPDACYTAEELEAMAEELRTIENEFVPMYMTRYNKSEDDLKALMAENRELTAKEALEVGFIDEISNPTLTEADAILARLNEREKFYTVLAEKRVNKNFNLDSMEITAEKKSVIAEAFAKIQKALGIKAETTPEPPAEPTPPTPTPEEPTAELATIKAEKEALEAEKTALAEKLAEAEAKLAAKETEATTLATANESIKAEVLAIKNTLTATFGEELKFAPTGQSGLGEHGAQAESTNASKFEKAAAKMRTGKVN